MKKIKEFFVKIKENKPLKLISILVVCILLILIINISRAFLGAYATNEGSTSISVSTYSVDKFIAKPMSLNMTGEAITQNKSATANTPVTLIANDETNNATKSYHVYLVIEKNDFVYSINGSTPELLLEIKGPDGNVITSLPGLAYTTSGGVSGFDVTTKNGIVPLIANDASKTISTTNTTTGIIDNWQAKLTYVKQSGNQNANNGKIFKSNIIFSEDTISITPKETSIDVTIPAHLKNGKAITSYNYKIKEATSTSNYNEFPNQTSNNYTFTKLTEGTKYNILVEGTDKTNTETLLNTEVNTKTNLLNYIINSFTSQGANGLYHHTSSLANSANDGSYRYAGADPNNYVCLGECKTDDSNKYRILGVIDNKVRLMKYTSLVDESGYEGCFWDRNRTNNWKKSTLRAELNDPSTGFLSTLGEYKDKIESTTWYLGPSDTEEYTARQFYNKEHNKSKTCTDKIGIMYVSDYGFAALPKYWKIIVGNYDGDGANNDWIYIPETEQWTIVSNTSDKVYHVSGIGWVFIAKPSSAEPVRPVFSLSTDVTFSSGNGTPGNPFII